MTRRRVHAEPRRHWTAGEDAVVRELYPDHPTLHLAAHLPGRSLTSIYNRARMLGIAKSAAYLASAAAGRLDGVRGAATRFRPGNRPWNAGTHFVAGGASIATRFQKGARPHTAVPVGTKVKATDGYWKIKVAEPNQWRWCHRLAWEETHGPIPRGMALVFRDRNPDHYDIANLELITREALMRRNTVHNYPAPIPELVQLRGALTRKINRWTASHAE